MATEQKVVFPPAVLARISPELTLQRHLAQGLRPCLREFTEFRETVVSEGSMADVGTDAVVGSSVIKHGDCHAFCGITLGVSEVNSAEDEFAPPEPESSKYTSVYPIVEVARGRQGAPSDEEQILSQKLYNYIYHLRLLPQASLDITPGYQIKDEATGDVSIIYTDDEDLSEEELLTLSSSINISKKQYRFVLYAHIKVFSRDGPLFDLVSRALITALKDVTLPRIYLADSGVDPNVKVPVRSRGHFGHLNQASGNIYIDTIKDLAQPVRLNTRELGLSSSFGIIELDDTAGQSAILADLEGEAEEACCETKVNIIASKNNLKHVSVSGGGANVTLDALKKIISLSRERAEKLL